VAVCWIISLFCYFVLSILCNRTHLPKYSPFTHHNSSSTSHSRPSIIKACFSTAHVQSTVDGGSLLGSPMLDGALGQVASITNAMDVLFPPDSTTAVMKSDKTDISQFDSILPPEVPTSWVQCETCRKWRRVAWHVDNGTLPDLWDCSMNYWDSENASCDAPQDR
jgi:CW-type Zinc Finger